MDYNNSNNTSMRVLHRYIGFFMAGIMAVYALSGIVMIFRDTDVFRVKNDVMKVVALDLTEEELGRELGIKNLKFDTTIGDVRRFTNGIYNYKYGNVDYISKDLPFVLEKLTRLHKASTNDPLFYFNIFFGLALLFFVLSSFYMFRSTSKIFKKGLYYTLAGIVLMFILLYF